MKKVIAVVLLIILTTTLIVAPAYAKSDKAKGAVKADLTVLQQGSGGLIVGTLVGSVNLNTTADGTLIVVIKIDAVPNLDDYAARIHINNSYKPIFEDVLSTNTKGNGVGQIKVNLLDANGNPMFTGDSISVDVVLRPSFNPGTTPSYTTNWPTDVIVPLK